MASTGGYKKVGDVRKLREQILSEFLTTVSVANCWLLVSQTSDLYQNESIWIM